MVVLNEIPLIVWLILLTEGWKSFWTLRNFDKYKTSLESAATIMDNNIRIFYYICYCLGVEAHLIHQYAISSNNKSTYLNVYCLKHRCLLTMNITIHTLYIVNHPSYICIALWRVHILIFKANFCRKGADLGQVRNLTIPILFQHMIEI